jgi:hypothetical protein
VTWGAKLVPACAAALTALALGRVAATYGTFSATYDEPAHISAGMEWLQYGTYTYEPQHPPLARVAVALGPYLSGLRSKARREPGGDTAFLFDEGNNILYSNGHGDENLLLARLGVLPFFVLLCVATFCWGRRYFGSSTALCALSLVACTPPILGHAGVATLDIACAATTLTALYRFLLWVESPALYRAVLLGLSTGVAVLCKFSTIPFLAGGFATGLAIGCRAPGIPRRRLLSGFVLASAVTIAVLWSGYRFTLTPLVPMRGTYFDVKADALSGAGFWSHVVRIPIPLQELVVGVLDLLRHNDLGHDTYLLGQTGLKGWWYFFPVVLAVKTPIGLMVLAVAGVILAFSRPLSWPRAITALFPLPILAVCMSSNLNLGIRHILPIYPLLAILAGEAAVTLLRQGRVARILAGVLLAWVLVDSIRTHPDYLADFNEFAEKRPERFVCDSDLDWGQDLKRLARRLSDLGADRVSISYFGTAPLDRAGLPPYHILGRNDRSTGFVAISVHNLCVDSTPGEDRYWLRSYQPRERIGKSIDLYYIPEPR